MKRAIGIMGTRGHVPGVAFMTTPEAMKRVGQNTGNLVFQYACFRLIHEEKVLIGAETGWNAAEVRSRCRAVVVPSANFFRENFDLSGLVSFLEKVDLPLVFIGLGAQAASVEVKSLDLHPSLHRLAALMRERCKLTSTRGQFSSDILGSLGVEDTVVTGCPSNFINLAPDFPEQIERKLARPLQSFITHLVEPSPKDVNKLAAQRRLTAWTAGSAAIQVAQSVPNFFEFLRRNNPATSASVPPAREASLHAAMMPGTSLGEFRAFLANRLRTYFSADQWFEESSRFDFSVGLRLHGNMAAWQSGTPALWVHHDSRTHELVETMALPNLDLKTFLATCTTVDDARRAVNYDKARYRVTRRVLGQRLMAVLAAAGIETVPELAALQTEAGQV
jgi:hypothetical protein